MTKLIKYNRAVINDYIEEGLDNYFIHGMAPGSFLYAVLTNNLYSACDKADFKNIQYLGKIAKWISGNIIHTAYGSEEKVQAWMDDVDNVRTDYVQHLEKTKMWEVLAGNFNNDEYLW